MSETVQPDPGRPGWRRRRGPITDPTDAIPIRGKIGYSAGLAAANSSAAAIGVLINPIFNITLGLSPALISAVLFIQRLWNVSLDPLAGHFSDNFRSRWGRRRPFILMAALPFGASFASIWFFPRWAGPGELLAYLVVASLVFYTVHSIYSVPLVALGMEITPDYHERTRLNIWAQTGSFILLIAIQWAFPLIQLKIFPSLIDGARAFALLFGAGLVAAAALPFFLNREPLHSSLGLRPRDSFRQSLLGCLRNGPFMRIASIRAIYAFSYNIVSVLGLYINYYYIFHGDIRRAAIMQGWNGTVFQLAGIGSLFVLRQFAIRFGKREAVLLGIGVFAFGCIAKLLVYVPELPALQLVVYVSNGISAAAITAPVDAMLPDIADYEERRSGRRREGMYASVLAWFDRSGNSVGTLFSGFLLVCIGFDVHRGGAQAAETLRLMRYFYSLVPFLGACSILWILRGYPLHAAKCRHLRRELEFRRAVALRGAA